MKLVDEGNSVYAAVFDFSEAFNRVSHQLQKLSEVVRQRPVCSAPSCELTAIESYLRWGMIFDVNKCQIDCFNRSFNFSSGSYTFNKEPFEVVESFKYFDVEIQNNFSWDSHIDGIEEYYFWHRAELGKLVCFILSLKDEGMLE